MREAIPRRAKYIVVLRVGDARKALSESGGIRLLDELRGLGSGWQEVYCYEDSCYEYIETCA
jgi:hypothetical protein